MWGDIPGLGGYRGSREGEIQNRRGRIMRQRDTENGAKKIDIGKATFMVHDLIAKAFHGRPPGNDYRVIHLNEDLSDNRADNLAYAEKTRIARCDNGHALTGENIVIVDSEKGCLRCWMDVLDVGSPRWLDYYLSRTFPELFAREKETHD